jgi:hypothetical protein
MARSTFDGPILAGSNRFGPLRNVGYTDISQLTTIVLTNTTNATAGYAGGSGQFVNGNGIPNTNAVVYTPSSSVYPPVAATITADAVGSPNTTGTLYRGIVFYLPYQANINDFLIDTNALITLSAGTVGTVTASIGNAFNSTTYGSITSMNAAAARNVIAQTGAQLLAKHGPRLIFSVSGGFDFHYPLYRWYGWCFALNHCGNNYGSSALYAGRPQHRQLDDLPLR